MTQPDIDPQGRQKPRFADRAHPADGAKVRYMACSGGYIMARRPRCMPFVLSEKEWGKWDLFREPAADFQKGVQALSIGGEAS